jgi:23S rRNA (cytidine1920-2'-O)/16S rRNA (cytidine1409-2'-O)-methyltransferase
VFDARIETVAKKRLDTLLVDRGLAESRNQAQRLIMAGKVRVEGQLVDQASSVQSEDAEVHVIEGPRFVSRGGEKLEAALASFQVPVLNAICADVGASTGGFTDCLLQHGASRVFAIDVGKGQLHWKLRQDPRVVVMDKTNARHVENLPELVDIVTIDASFISLRVLFPVVHGWLRQNGWLIALIKPQFEAGKKDASRGKGVIRDPQVHRQLLEEIVKVAVSEDFSIAGLITSPILGPKGNKEFLLGATRTEQPDPHDPNLIQAVLLQ